MNFINEIPTGEMKKLYKEKKQYRLPNYDYSGYGNYFITINTQNRYKKYFGKIINNKIQLSEMGNIVDKIWNQIPIQFPDVLLDVYQIMPDHFHAIIKMRSSENLTQLLDEQGYQINKSPIKFKSAIINNPMELKQKTLGYIIRWFKGKVKFESNKVKPDFKWQSRFYDRVIRDDKEFYFIQKYIEDNPLNYKVDKDDEELLKYLKGI